MNGTEEERQQSGYFNFYIVAHYLKDDLRLLWNVEILFGENKVSVG